ncbi:hypothetical protein ACRRTK_021556 [Alexandromys fortis]
MLSCVSKLMFSQSTSPDSSLYIISIISLEYTSESDAFSDGFHSYSPPPFQLPLQGPTRQSYSTLWVFSFPQFYVFFLTEILK